MTKLGYLILIFIPIYLWILASCLSRTVNF